MPELKGIALFDRLETRQRGEGDLPLVSWSKREIENYLCTQATLEAWAAVSAPEGQIGPLFIKAQAKERVQAMREAIVEVSAAMETIDKESPWDADAKVSDRFLTPLFRNYFKRLNLPNLMQKKNFYELADHVPDHEIDPEIREKLDAIAQVAESAGQP